MPTYTGMSLKCPSGSQQTLAERHALLYNFVGVVKETLGGEIITGINSLEKQIHTCLRKVEIFQSTFIR